MFGSPQSVSPIVTRLASLLAKSEVVWNPMIYVLMAESWYTALRGIVWCTAQTDSRPEQR
ncbi:hypothetical protein DPMN_117567 [Dreissena polymorpha]|uniref:Uncharacterized protein n=1 Tax=Dreissena polymorpha TaxID=45954 RepID=A0A9D4GJ81_DREPO|nr:hypothetical protein DPMN_117567 [Dreissena polymorpha]